MPARINSTDILCNNNGEWWVDWLDNHVMVLGPAADIQVFKKLCIVPETKGAETKQARILLNRVMPLPKGLSQEDRRNWRNDHWGSDREPWNVKIDVSPDPWTLSFSFETGGGFPEPIFRKLAQQFPRLAVYSFSRPCGDLYVEFGWFNTPPGGYDFHEVDLYDDPPEHTECGVLRDPMAELRHQAVIAHVKKIAQQIDGALL